MGFPWGQGSLEKEFENTNHWPWFRIKTADQKNE